MEIQARDRAAPFTTKDGSAIRELMHAANQSLAEATLSPGQQTERHYHAASEELYYLLEGEGEMEVDGERSSSRARRRDPDPARRLAPDHRPGGSTGGFCRTPSVLHADTFFDGPDRDDRSPAARGLRADARAVARGRGHRRRDALDWDHFFPLRGDRTGSTSSA